MYAPTLQHKHLQLLHLGYRYDYFFRMQKPTYPYIIKFACELCKIQHGKLFILT